MPHNMEPLFAPTFLLQVKKSTPLFFDRRLPTPPPAAPCDYGCARSNLCKSRQESCKAFRSYVTCGLEKFKEWDSLLALDIIPLDSGLAPGEK